MTYFQEQLSFFKAGLFPQSSSCTIPAPDFLSTDVCFIDEGAGSTTSFVLQLRINLLFPSCLPGHFSATQLCLLVCSCSGLDEHNDTSVPLGGK